MYPMESLERYLHFEINLSPLQRVHCSDQTLTLKLRVLEWNSIVTDQIETPLLKAAYIWEKGRNKGYRGFISIFQVCQHMTPRLSNICMKLRCCVASFWLNPRPKCDKQLLWRKSRHQTKCGLSGCVNCLQLEGEVLKTKMGPPRVFRCNRRPSSVAAH